VRAHRRRRCATDLNVDTAIELEHAIEAQPSQMRKQTNQTQTSISGALLRLGRLRRRGLPEICPPASRFMCQSHKSRHRPTVEATGARRGARAAGPARYRLAGAGDRRPRAAHHARRDRARRLADSDRQVHALLRQRLIREEPRAAVPGRGIPLVTTDLVLRRLGVGGLGELQQQLMAAAPPAQAD
jgi:hypothetical protein